MNSLLIASALINLIVLVIVLLLWRRAGAQNSGDNSAQTAQVFQRLESLDQGLSQKFTDLSVRLEKTRGELNLELSKQLSDGLSNVRSAVESQLTKGREEQTGSLAIAITNLEGKFDLLTQRQSQNAQESRAELTKSLETIRGEVDKKLNDITGQVQQKLDANIKEGFAHFEKVQEHLRSAEEQLRNVGMLGNSIHDLNNLLKLPHLRGKFGEASLERLLADFLPANMFTLQMGPQGSTGRADAMIHFPERDLPIDAKFPREQVLALFDQDSAGAEKIEEARRAFERVMKDQAKRIKGYIQPENGTTEIALMYLPSETLYMEAVRNRDLSEELNKLKVFPVSPNTLMVTLQAVSMVHKWYQVQKGLAKSIEDLGKAQKNFASFESKFEVIGKSLERAQDAYSTATTHLNRYKSRVVKLSGEEVPELTNGEGESDPEKNMAAKA
jgi:DNA recombination protein RmuC